MKNKDKKKSQPRKIQEDKVKENNTSIETDDDEQDYKNTIQPGNTTKKGEDRMK